MGAVMAQTAKPYAKIPTLFDRVQDELSAIEAITRVLGALPDHETRLRVINWVSDRFSQGMAAEAQPAATAAVRPAAADSALSIPDDLFDPVVEMPEPADLHGVFDQPARPHSLGLENVFEMPAEKRQPIPIRPAEPAFELVPPTETPARADLDDAASDEPGRATDRRQLNLLLLADMSTPAALKISDAPTTGDSAGAASREPDARSPRRSFVLATIHARDSKPAVTKKAATAPGSADKAPKAKPRPIAAQPSNPEPPQDSVEAMLRSLVDDFRHLADEWGNT